MTDTIVLRVTGVPITQGSKTAILIGGRPRVVEGKGAGRKRHADWRADVAAEARRWQEAHGHPPLLTGPLSVMCLFALPKPASAPKRTRTWPIKARSGDLDKLARSILDSCTGTLWVDDSQVVRLVAEKDWGDPPGVLVTVRPVSGEGAVLPTPVREGERACIQPPGPLGEIRDVRVTPLDEDGNPSGPSVSVPPAPSKVQDLMAALEQSLAAVRTRECIQPSGLSVSVPATPPFSRSVWVSRQER